MKAEQFMLEVVTSSDLPKWLDSKRECYKDYVDQYYGGWFDDVQVRLNKSSFDKARKMSYFRKIVLNGETAGFCGYDVQQDKIVDVTIHMYEFARNKGIGSSFLYHLTECSCTAGKPAYLKVFKTNPAKRLYERFGFTIYGETDSHYLMVFKRNADA